MGSMRIIRYQIATGILSLVLCLATACVTQQEGLAKKTVDLGHQYAKDGLLREAAQSYQKALLSEPKNPAANRNLGLIYVKTGEYKKAITHLTVALPNYRQNFETNFYLAQALRAEDRYSDAIYHYKVALNIKPKDLRAMKALAWSNYKIRFYQEAQRLAADLQKIAPEDVQTHIIMARILLRMKQPRKALAVIQNAQAFSKKSEQPYLTSVEGEVYLEMRRYEDAQKSFRAALKEQPLLAGSLLGLGRAMLEMGTKTNLTVSYLERALRLKPSLKEGYYYLARYYEESDPIKSQKFYAIFRRQARDDPEFTEQLTVAQQKINDRDKEKAKLQ